MTSAMVILINVRDHLDEACALERASQIYDALSVMRHAALLAHDKGDEQMCPACIPEDDADEE